MDIDAVITAILKYSRIGITFHISPDGDSIGSALSLARGLKKLGKSVSIYCKEKPPETFKYLSGIKEITGYNTDINLDTQCLIVLDCGDPNRISANLSIKNRHYVLINIDHHKSNSSFGDINYVDSKASAVGEMIYDILLRLNIPIDKETSECLYTSIASDTGGFKYSNTTPKTLSIVAELIKLGIDFSLIHRTIFENKKFDRIKLYGKVIERLYLTEDKKICIMQLKRDMNPYNCYDFGDTSDVISLGMKIDSVEVAILFKEAEDGVKVSFRSKSIVDVSEIAQGFGGGGHMRAAGLTLHVPYDESIKLITDAVKSKM